jgi:cytochrome c-type biogenesis protein CcmH/NrfG
VKIRQKAAHFILTFLILTCSSFPLPAESPAEIDQTQTRFEKTLAQDPHNKEALFVLGLIYEKKGQKADALRMWRSYESIETDPDQQRMARKHIHQLSQ